MKKSAITLFTLLFLVFGVSGASATPSLLDWAFYVDGSTYEYLGGFGDSMSDAGVGGTLTDGLGTLSWTTSAAGSHTFISFFDHEIDEPINTFFNEYGESNGTPAIDQSWEIDEPGYVFGDIYWNVLGGALDNSNAVPAAAPDDVSMALGWDFSLAVDETATISLILRDMAPLSGFYLSHIDPESLETIYFSSGLDIRGGPGPGPAPIPEPGTILLVCTGLAGLFGLKTKLR